MSFRSFVIVCVAAGVVPQFSFALECLFEAPWTRFLRNTDIGRDYSTSIDFMAAGALATSMIGIALCLIVGVLSRFFVRKGFGVFGLLTTLALSSLLLALAFFYEEVNCRSTENIVYSDCIEVAENLREFDFSFELGPRRTVRVWGLGEFSEATPNEVYLMIDVSGTRMRFFESKMGLSKVGFMRDLLEKIESHFENKSFRICQLDLPSSCFDRN
jgi:hypothetical protein